MTLIATPTLTEEQQTAVMQLWNEEYPERLVLHSLAEMQQYLNGLKDPAHWLLSTDAGLAGWCVRFLRDNETWFAVIVTSKNHQQGIGTTLLRFLQSSCDSLCGWVIDKNEEQKQDGSPYRSPLGFYLRQNFSVLPEIRLETEKLSAVKIVWKKPELKA